jgi:hypothetical protein
MSRRFAVIVSGAVQASRSGVYPFSINESRVWGYTRPASENAVEVTFVQDFDGKWQS